jgi:helicase MOV-10
MVKLVQNFRSHAAILKFPNDRFYNGDLEEVCVSQTADYHLLSRASRIFNHGMQCGDQRIIDSFIGWPKLPRPEREFPIIFHAIHGKDDRESTSPSFFNIDEVLQVKAYVNDLRSDRKARLSTSVHYHLQQLLTGHY